MNNKELLIILKQVEACIKKGDWINAKEYIMLEIEKINLLVKSK